MQEIKLELPYPPSANRYWRTFVAGRRAITHVSTEATKYKQDVGLIARANSVVKISGRIHLEIWLYPHRPLDWQKRKNRVVTCYEGMPALGWDDDVRCLDTSNCIKIVEDSLKGICFSDDKWVRSLRAERMEPDENGARLVVRISQWTPTK